MTHAANEGPRRAGRGVKIALGISLALNLAVLGAIGGAVLTGAPGAGMHDRLDMMRSLGLGPMGLALERDDREEIAARATTDRVALRADRRALLEATLAFSDAVAAEPFDRAAAAAALQAQRGHVVGLQERGHLALLDQLETMPQAARERFTDRLRHALTRHGDRR